MESKKKSCEENVEEDSGGKPDDCGDEEGGVPSARLPTVVIRPYRRTGSSTPGPGPDYNPLETSSRPAILLPESDSPHGSHDHERGAQCQVAGLASIKILCGLNPARILAGSVAVISVYVTWIILIHLNIKIEHLTSLVENTNLNIRALEDASMDQRASDFKSDRALQRSLNEILLKISQGIAPPGHDKDYENAETLKYGKDNDTNRILKDTDSEEVLPVHCTIHGSECVLPFLYKDRLWTDCVHLWTDRNPWCATTVALGGQFVDTGDNWDYCGQC